MTTTLDALRRYAVRRTFFPPTTLKRALHRFGFVQADPIRAPARAQDLTLRHRVKDYRAGDLELHYAKLGIQEDFFTVYGFVTSALHALMHPRTSSSHAFEGRRPWSAEREKQAQRLLNFVAERGSVHPREVDAHFMHGKVINYWGGTSNATTHLLSAMHYRGMLRIVRRDAGIRVYAVHQHGPEPIDPVERDARIDALADIVVRIYAPLPARSLAQLVRRLRFAAPQWRGELTSALNRARKRLSHAKVDGIDWYWPPDEKPTQDEPEDVVRLLTPFDPLVWDRTRFELFWNWQYRFEAYTPALKRKLGYYALPLLWRDHIVGWGNVKVEAGKMQAEIGYVDSKPPKDRAFKRELEGELDRMRVFLSLRPNGKTSRSGGSRSRDPQ